MARGTWAPRWAAAVSEYDTTRNITLGAATRTETGNANGWQFVGRLIGGYWFKAGDWIHGPTVKLTYQEIRVRPVHRKTGRTRRR